MPRTCLGTSLAALVLALAACGGAEAPPAESAASAGSAQPPAQYSPYGYHPPGATTTGTSGGEGLEAAPAAAPPAAREEVMAESESGSGGNPLRAILGGSSDSDSRGGAAAGQASATYRAPAAQIAQNQQQQSAGGRAAQAQARETASDVTASGGPLLIYMATLHLAVYEVEQQQRAVIAIARELGGFLALRDDQRIVIRVPARKFNDAVGRVEEVGDVLHRNVEAIDISEEYRDLEIRLRNAEAMRTRLERLLDNAHNVQEALQVEHELERITEVLETIKGRLRFLDDRVSFSTITVYFAPRPTEGVDQPDIFRLPFPWLDELGLRTLLNLGVP